MSASPSRSVKADTPAGAQSFSRDVPVVVFFGTSLTAGPGLEPEQAYPALVEKLAAADGTPIKAVNAGESGETTAGAVRRIDWVLKNPADVVVIETGANDALRGLDPDSARSNIERVVASVKRKQPNARIALVQMEAPPNFGSPYTRRFHAIYADVAKQEGVPLLPFLLNGVAGISALNQGDGVHPNAAGEKIVAANVWKSLAPLVKEVTQAR
jgi:acyl-CoA thioesterase I